MRDYPLPPPCMAGSLYSPGWRGSLIIACRVSVQSRETQLAMAMDRMKTNQRNRDKVVVGLTQTMTGIEQPKPGVPRITDPELDAVVAGLKNIKFSKEITKDEEQVEAPKISSCVCERSRMLILCGSCGITFPGRLRTPCSDHPNNMYLLDVDECKGCKRDKQELVAYELPREMKEGIKNPRIK